MDEYEVDNPTLHTLYPTLLSFKTDVIDVCFLSVADFAPLIDATDLEKGVIAQALYSFYGDSKVIASDKEGFEKIAGFYFTSVLPSALSRLRRGALLYSTDKIESKGGVESLRHDEQTLVSSKDGSITHHDSEEKTNEQTGTSKTKQADTPTVVAPNTEFNDDYTNYRSDTANGATLHENTAQDKSGVSEEHKQDSDNETHSSSVSRTASASDILSVYERLPRSLFIDLISSVAQCFISIYYL